MLQIEKEAARTKNLNEIFVLEDHYIPDFGLSINRKI
jgi:hypothetical protein